MVLTFFVHYSHPELFNKSSGLHVQQRSGLPITPHARFRHPESWRPEYVRTLNGSGLAVGRTLITIMENWRDGDGVAHAPDMLRPSMRGAMRRASSLTSAQRLTPCLPGACVFRRHVAK